MRRTLSLLAAALLAVGSGWVAVEAYVWSRGTRPGPSAVAQIASPVSAAEPEPASPGSPERLPAFAVARGLRLHLPVARPVALAYHEASMPRRLALRPLGSCVVCLNRSKFRPPRVGPSGMEYMVMDTRGRPGGATSAVDVVLRRRDLVLSPVTGRVRSVRRYRLYGRYRDVRVAIRPHGRPDLLVVVIHLRDVRLRPGQRVVASLTVLGRTRPFPFESHVDRYVRGPDRFPHTHLEVKGRPRRRT